MDKRRKVRLRNPATASLNSPQSQAGEQSSCLPRPQANRRNVNNPQNQDNPQNQPEHENCQHFWYLPDEFYTDTIKCAYCGIED